MFYNFNNHSYLGYIIRAVICFSGLLTVMFGAIDTTATSLNPFSGKDAPVCQNISQYPDPNRDPYQIMQVCHVQATGAQYIDFRDNQLTEPVTQIIPVNSHYSEFAMLPAISANLTLGAPVYPGVRMQYTPCTYGAVLIYHYPEANDQGHIYEYELLNLRPPEDVLRKHDVKDVIPEEVYISKASRDLPGTAQLSTSTVSLYCENLGGY